MKIRPNVLFPIISFYFQLNTIHVLSAHHNSSSDSYLLNCGSTSVESDTDGRNWEPDQTYLSSANQPNACKAEYQNPSLPSTVPYMTAMIFKSKATYSFPINTKGRHWVRLHFYPSTYNNLNTINSFFSVTVGGIPLLKEFCPGFTTQTVTQAVIVTEFSVYVMSSELDITFFPFNGSFALINGIEVISMPDIFTEPATLEGFSDQSIDIHTPTIQTMYRLNVGGHFIPRTKDSGLTRVWHDDSPYLLRGSVGVAVEVFKNEPIKYPTTVAEYIAPMDVYSTARSMGPEPEENMKYNLTWIFSVDSHFTYIIRLHFCELEWSKVNQRVFDIFINNQTAQAGADVIAWAGSRDVPYYKDFAIYVDNNDEELSVGLHPSKDSKPEVYDAILNGLEVFKVYKFY